MQTLYDAGRPAHIRCSTARAQMSLRWPRNVALRE